VRLIEKGWPVSRRLFFILFIYLFICAYIYTHMEELGRMGGRKGECGRCRGERCARIGSSKGEFLSLLSGREKRRERKANPWKGFGMGAALT
jgi:hypothetical protein